MIRLARGFVTLQLFIIFQPKYLYRRKKEKIVNRDLYTEHNVNDMICMLAVRFIVVFYGYV